MSQLTETVSGSVVVVVVVGITLIARCNGWWSLTVGRVVFLLLSLLATIESICVQQIDSSADLRLANTRRLVILPTTCTTRCRNPRGVKSVLVQRLLKTAPLLTASADCFGHRVEVDDDDDGFRCDDSQAKAFSIVQTFFIKHSSVTLRAPLTSPASKHLSLLRHPKSVRLTTHADNSRVVLHCFSETRRSSNDNRREKTVDRHHDDHPQEAAVTRKKAVLPTGSNADKLLCPKKPKKTDGDMDRRSDYKFCSAFLRTVCSRRLLCQTSASVEELDMFFMCLEKDGASANVGLTTAPSKEQRHVGRRRRRDDDDDDDLLKQHRICSAYVGFDLNAPSLHVGHLVPLILLRWWRRFGWQPIVLLGDSTASFNDRSHRKLIGRRRTTARVGSGSLTPGRELNEIPAFASVEETHRKSGGRDARQCFFSCNDMDVPMFPDLDDRQNTSEASQLALNKHSVKHIVQQIVNAPCSQQSTSLADVPSFPHSPDNNASRKVNGNDQMQQSNSTECSSPNNTTTTTSSHNSTTQLPKLIVLSNSSWLSSLSLLRFLHVFANHITMSSLIRRHQPHLKLPKAPEGPNTSADIQSGTPCAELSSCKHMDTNALPSSSPASPRFSAHSSDRLSPSWCEEPLRVSAADTDEIVSAAVQQRGGNSLLNAQSYFRSSHLTDLLYQVLQAVDFCTLAKHYNTRVQIGGLDQLGNIAGGITLADRLKLGRLHGLTSPLLTASGSRICSGGRWSYMGDDVAPPDRRWTARRKMGKSTGGKVVWLDRRYTTPFEFWQFWRNCADQEIHTNLRMFTDLSLEQIEELTIRGGKDMNRAKVLLADLVTQLVHGADAVTAIHRLLEGQTFGVEAATNTLQLQPAELKNGTKLADLLVACSLCTSKSEARRRIREGSVHLNELPEFNPFTVVGLEHFRVISPTEENQQQTAVLKDVPSHSSSSNVTAVVECDCNSRRSSNGNVSAPEKPLKRCSLVISLGRTKKAVVESWRE